MTSKEDRVIVESPWEGPVPDYPPKEAVYKIQARYNIEKIDSVTFPRPDTVRVEGRTPTA